MPEGQHSVEELIAERDRMRNVLADVELRRLATSEIPTDAYTYFGRLESLDREIQKLTIDQQKLALADRLTGYASVFEKPCAEACIATNFAAQIRAGKDAIDLTQQYETTDPVKAAVRHARAVRNIQVLIEQATTLGLSVHSGHAIAVTTNANRLSVQHEIESRLPTPEPARFSL